MTYGGFYPSSSSTGKKAETGCENCRRLTVALEGITHVIAAYQAVAIAKDALHPPKESK